MPSTQIIQWALWGASLLAGVVAVVKMSRLIDLQRLIPTWEQAKDAEARLPVRQEELRQTTERISQLHGEIAGLDATVGHLRILKKWQEEHPEAATQIQQMMVEHERLKSELAAIQQNLAQEQQRFIDVDQEVKRLTLEKNQLSQESGIMRDQLANLHKQKAELEKVIRDLDEQRRQLETKVARLNPEIMASESRLSGLRQQITEGEQEKAAAIRERDQARADRDCAKAETIALKKEHDAFMSMLDRLRKDADRLGVATPDTAVALEDLAQPALKFQFQQSSNLDEPRALRRLADHLKAKGLHYPERVQLAFHTSLKAAQINPLVVLAGVSGTGKSALPIAYAEATGMNCLSLAVQPGWSGPQDLLGFYNYLERKYKATELARALAQMSRFSKDDLPGLKIESRKEQMLLLLLDEMNLARIEYYFSDFLSRLEQRRGRDVENPQRRQEVSLLVDAGSLPAGERSRFIFPDFNVLFVGTMNEDESTQSLSDKVIDRANVLRFGAPKELQAASAGTIAPTSDFLPRATWDRWVKSFDGNGFQNERTTLTKLNQTLETVNRPFGHRVYRAILDYLANYPGASTDPTRCRNALADQMEQKIIPKLRGLDTQDDATAICLDHLAQTISDLQDPELSEAFNRARQQHLFEWFGVKRS